MGISEFDDGFEDAPNRRQREEAEEHKLGESILRARIRALKPKPAVMVTEGAPIKEAIQVMLDRKIGAVLVIRGEKPVGIFTERDVLRRVAVSGIDLKRPVSDVMTPSPETLGIDDGIAFAINRMIVRGFRHIPIVEKNGRPVAVLSVREVVSFIVSLLPARIHNLPPEPALGIPKTPDGG